jgi:hypothetical protein
MNEQAQIKFISTLACMALLSLFVVVVILVTKAMEIW